MGQILHGSATTTEAVRRAIQHSQESLRGLAKRYGVNPKTVAKWKARTSVSDLPTGPKEPRSTVLSAEEEAVVVAFRRHTLLPPDDCLYALQPTIPHLTRSSLQPVSATPRDLSAAPSRRRSFAEAQVQGLSDRLFPCRHRRGSNRSGQALSHRRHRPNVKARLRRDAPEGGAPHRGGLPAPPDRRRPLQGPYRPHRQRNPLHHARQYELGCAGHQGRPGGWRAPLGARLRIRLRPERHRSSADQAQTPLDQRASRKNEPHHQGRDRQTLLLRDPRPAANAPARLRRRLQLRQTPQNPQRPDPIRVHLQSLDFRAEQIQNQPAPANAGTKHLASRELPIRIGMAIYK